MNAYRPLHRARYRLPLVPASRVRNLAGANQQTIRTVKMQFDHTAAGQAGDMSQENDRPGAKIDIFVGRPIAIVNHGQVLAVTRAVRPRLQGLAVHLTRKQAGAPCLDILSGQQRGEYTLGGHLHFVDTFVRVEVDWLDGHPAVEFAGLRGAVVENVPLPVEFG